MIIENKYIPVKGFIAMAVFPFIFVRSDKMLKEDDVNHELIHFQQQKELFIIPFYLIYLFEYLLNLYVYGDKKQAYRSISFEKEAYKHDKNQDYLKTRKYFAQWR